MTRAELGLLAIAFAGGGAVFSAQGCSNELLLGGLGGGSSSGQGGAIVGTSSSSTSGTGGVVSTSSSTSSGPPPCMTCGQPCELMPCNGSNQPPCMVMGYCDLMGLCQPTYPGCNYQPCGGMKCGDPCSPCDPNDPSCGTVANSSDFRCDANGQCLAGPVTCCAMGNCPMAVCNPMTPCGTPCDPCQGMPGCMTFGSFLCDGTSQCLPVDQVACPAGYRPCEAAACGDACSPCLGGNCPPGPKTVCDIFGHCTDAIGMDCKSPCANKRCGDDCRFCELTAPNDPSCMNAPPDGKCDDEGKCIAATDPLVAYPPYCACAALKCNTPCNVCDPNDTGCVEPPGPNTCDGLGRCIPGMVQMCP